MMAIAWLCGERNKVRGKNPLMKVSRERGDEMKPLPCSGKDEVVMKKENAKEYIKLCEPTNYCLPVN
jgi:hypothetical protein